MLKILGTLFLSVFISTSLYAGEQTIESVPGEYVLKLNLNVSDFSQDDLEIMLNSKIKTIIPDLNIVVVYRAIVELEGFVLKELNDNEIIVVAGGSTDGGIEYLCKQKNVLTIIQHNNGNWKGNKIDKKSCACPEVC